MSGSASVAARLLPLLLACACGRQVVIGIAHDAGEDAGTTGDAGWLDSGHLRDGGLPDGGAADGGVSDAGALADAGAADGGTTCVADGGAWMAFALAATEPVARVDHVAVYDPAGQRMVVHSGHSNSSTFPSDVWTLSLGVTEPPTWRQLVATGSAPTARRYHAAVYDSARRRLVVLGGLSGSGTVLRDVWSLDPAEPPSWSEIAASGTSPAARYGHSANFDSSRDRIITYGGTSGGTFHGDVWALQMSPQPRWEPVAPSGTPPTPRADHVALYDARRDRLVVFGGVEATGTRLGDAWTLALSGTPTWNALASGGEAPSARDAHAAVLDTARDRLILHGGRTTGAILGDLWSLSLAGTPMWRRLDPAGVGPGGRAGHTVILDAAIDRLVLFGGSTPALANDLWALPLSVCP